MLEHLYIKNVALISEIDVDFSDGLNILSGETGAGKSIIIDSINFVLGEKAGKGFIKSGEDVAQVAVILSVNNAEVRDNLLKLSIECDDDNNVMLSRTLNKAGRNVYKINGKNVTGGILKEVSSLLIDIHGQHQHQSLLNQSKHIYLLDRFCEDEFEKLKEKLSVCAKQYKEITKKISELDISDDDGSKKELYTFQIDEIKSAKLKENEEKELLEKKKKIDSAVNLKRLVANVLNLLLYNESGNARDEISAGVSILYSLAELDKSREENAKELEEISIQLQEIISELKRYSDEIVFSEEEAKEVEERLDTIYMLKRKYGQDISEILKYLENTEKKLSDITNGAKTLKDLNKKKNEIEKEIAIICSQMSDIRKKVAQNTEKKVETTLHELGMENARFRIDISKKNSFSLNGWDRVEFMFSANYNQQPMPLSKIASGGEMSRVMLSLKNVLAQADTIETFIFDEIDTGVSGRTAQQVAEKLANLGKTHQILCITHLPQIAAMGDSNFLIEKETKEDKTQSTHLSHLLDDEVYNEIARLIGGAKITDTTIIAAKEMKQLADKIKEKTK